MQAQKDLFFLFFFVIRVLFLLWCAFDRTCEIVIFLLYLHCVTGQPGQLLFVRVCHHKRGVCVKTAVNTYQMLPAVQPFGLLGGFKIYVVKSCLWLDGKSYKTASK